MSKEQISDTYLECIKNDNVLLYQVNQNLRLVVKDLCIKINDLENEGRKQQRFNFELPEKDQNSLPKSNAKNSEEIKKEIEKAYLEIEVLNEKIEEFETENKELKKRIDEFAVSQKTKNEMNLETSKSQINSKMLLQKIEDLKNINTSLENENQRKESEINHFIEKITNMKFAVDEKEKKKTDEFQILNINIIFRN